MAESAGGADRGERRRTSRSGPDAAISFAACRDSSLGELVDFLTGNGWPFHAEASLDAESVRRRAAEGAFDTDEDRECWWVLDGAERVGLLVVFDLGDPTPLFDLRIAERHRGRGIGTHAVRWLTARVFTAGAGRTRIEATTRADNAAMRTVLRRCGYVKEAHYRQAWPGPDGTYDAVGYAILRADWETGSATPVGWDDELP